MTPSRLLLSIVVAASIASAQSTGAMKGELKCTRTPQSLEVPVGDSTGHSVGLSRYVCIWSKPVAIGGFNTANDSLTVFSEVRGDSVEVQGYETIAMTNGDRLSVRYRGINSVPKRNGKGQWRLALGEGRFRGIKGSGTFTSTEAIDGTLIIAFDGEFNLPAPTASSHQ